MSVSLSARTRAACTSSCVTPLGNGVTRTPAPAVWAWTVAATAPAPSASRLARHTWPCTGVPLKLTARARACVTVAVPVTAPPPGAATMLAAAVNVLLVACTTKSFAPSAIALNPVSWERALIEAASPVAVPARLPPARTV